MQMYKVKLHSQRGPVVDSGTFLVCATTAEAAELSVAGFCEIPPSLATFQTSRVKPSIYELNRSEHRIGDSIGFVGVSDEDPGAVHEVRASAKVFGYSESAVLRRFANAVIENASARKSALPKHINELSVEVERQDHRPAPSRVEEQSIFKEKRFFAGGAARPR
jgi:hypothetical protein